MTTNDTPDYAALWVKIENNAAPQMRYAVHGAIGEADATGLDRESTEWAREAVRAYREISSTP